jgi:DNA/RNA-binding protein KIN17
LHSLSKKAFVISFFVFLLSSYSESHLRQMRVFAENPNSVLDEFSSEFERGFLETLSQLHGTKRVKANTVYQEYIADKHHIHMNSTIWTTLTGFCMHVGKESKAIVDETEKGWFIQYIDRDPRVLARQAQNAAQVQYELDDEVRKKREIAAQILAAEEQLRESGGGGGDADPEVDNALVRDEGDGKIAISLKLAVAPVVSTAGAGAGAGASAAASTAGAAGAGAGAGAGLLKKRPRAALGFAGSDDDDDDDSKQREKGKATGSDTAAGTGAAGSRVGGVLASMIQEDERRRQAREQQLTATSKQEAAAQVPPSSLAPVVASTTTAVPPATGSVVAASKGQEAASSSSSKGGGDKNSQSWLRRDLYVKIVNKNVGKGRPYKLKGRITRMFDRTEEAEVEVDGDYYTVKKEDVETVLPKVRHHYAFLR